MRWVRPTGAIRWRQAEVDLTATLAGEPVGLTQAGDGRWQRAFGPVVLGVLDEHTRRLRPPTNRQPC